MNLNECVNIVVLSCLEDNCLVTGDLDIILKTSFVDIRNRNVTVYCDITYKVFAVCLTCKEYYLRTVLSSYYTCSFISYCSCVVTC